MARRWRLLSCTLILVARCLGSPLDFDTQFDTADSELDDWSVALHQAEKDLTLFRQDEQQRREHARKSLSKKRERMHQLMEARDQASAHTRPDHAEL